MRFKELIFLSLFLPQGLKATTPQEPQNCRILNAEGEINDTKFIRIPENISIGTEIFRVVAHPRQHFNIQAPDGSRANGILSFKEIDSHHVSIILAKSLEDFVDQSTPVNMLHFRLVCRGRDGTFDYLPTTVFIEDINDNAPQFTNNDYNLTIEEYTPPGLTIFRGIQAIDRDQPSSPNSEIHYSIVSGDEAQKFSLERGSNNNAILILRKHLDFENGDTYFNLTIQAEDAGTPKKKSKATLTIKVNDNDDMNPIFSQPYYQASIFENYPLTGNKLRELIHVTPTIEAFDQDVQLNATLFYEIYSGNEDKFFDIDVDSGALFQIAEIDRDIHDLKGFSLTLQVRQINKPLKMATTQVDILIRDLNDNIPLFEYSEFNVSITENLPNGFEIFQFEAVDIDTDENGAFYYMIHDPLEIFDLNPETGVLSIGNSEEFDREKYSVFHCTIGTLELNPSVILEEDASKYLTDQVHVHIYLEDENDNAPIFKPSSNYNFNISDTLKIFDVVGVVETTDEDDGNNGKVVYDLKNDYFTIDKISGEIIVTKVPLLDTKYILEVTAKDSANLSQNQLSSKAFVTIEVLNQGNYLEFPPGIQEFRISNLDEPGSIIGQVILNGKKEEFYKWSLVHSYVEGVPFGLDEHSGQIFVKKNLSRLFDVYMAKVILSSSATREISTHIRVHVEISKMSNNSQNLTFLIPENLSKTLITNLTQFLSFSKKPLRLEYHLLDSELEIKNNFNLEKNGLLYTKTPLDREEQEVYNLTIFINNKDLKEEGKAFQIIVIVVDENDNSPSFDRHIYEAEISIEDPPGTVLKLVHKILVHDPDSQDLIQLKLFGEGREYFKVDPLSHAVILISSLYSLALPSKICLRIRALDLVGHITEAQLCISIISFQNQSLVTDFTPNKWSNISGKNLINIQEDIPISAIAGQIIVYHKELSSIKFNLTSETQIQNKDNKTQIRHFAINEKTGEIIVLSPLMSSQKFILNVTITNINNGVKTEHSVFVTVISSTVLFTSSHYQFYLIEGTYKKYKIGDIFAKNAVFYEMKEEMPSLLLEPLTGALSIDGTLDRESVSNLTFVLRAFNIQGHFTESYGTLFILDANDNAPLFSNYSSSTIYNVPVYEVKEFREDFKLNEPIIIIIAFDADAPHTSNSKITYSLESNEFLSIEPQTGIVSLVKPLVSTIESYQVTIWASDKGSPSRDSMAYLVLTIKEKRKSIISNQEEIFINVTENGPSREWLINLHSYWLQNSFSSSSSFLIYFLEEENSKNFDLNPTTGDLSTRQSLDRETESQFTLKVRCSNSSKYFHNESYETIQILIHIFVLDLNDNAPKFPSSKMTASLDFDSPTNVHIITIKAKDEDEGLNGEIFYELTSPTSFFKLNSQTGELKYISESFSKLKPVMDLVIVASDKSTDHPLQSTLELKILLVESTQVLKLLLRGHQENVEKELNTLKESLTLISGYNFQYHRSSGFLNSTELSFYALDDFNNVLDMEPILKVLNSHLNSLSVKHSVIEVRSGAHKQSLESNSQIYLGSAEIGILVMASTIFGGGFLFALIICVIRAKRGLSSYPPPLNVFLPKLTFHEDRHTSENLKPFDSFSQSRRKIMFSGNSGDKENELNDSDTCIVAERCNSQTPESLRSWKDNIMNDQLERRIDSSNFYICGHSPSTGESCSEGEYDVPHRYKSRRHKSTSPCRKAYNRSHQHCHRVQTLNFCRCCSRSLGHINDTNCSDCCSHHRNGIKSRSTRSTKWEVYYNTQQ